MNPFPAPQSVVVLDNASTHHAPEFIQVLIDAGLRVEYTPPYTPQYNPIEELFGTLKTHIRRIGGAYLAVGGSDYLLIHRAFALITPENCRAWIRHAGYLS